MPRARQRQQDRPTQGSTFQIPSYTYRAQMALVADIRMLEPIAEKIKDLSLVLDHLSNQSTEVALVKYIPYSPCMLASGSFLSLASHRKWRLMR